ncbi:hypothetical protein CY34DRAFT_814351 [Suillus luteus UH-Slu-Lm8-n1]|uniref:Uncharacterized protein n=1 Tax=Suillus luteus UH-Slu-Lm8-n1 TaxID=930992 RepID=A0A0D0ADH3_9AGAM|nr:hypothetical protein CY34DRAFT_814351 [Suillus luteus UH-Slu-Lm8-n1]
MAHFPLTVRECPKFNNWLYLILSAIALLLLRSADQFRACTAQARLVMSLIVVAISSVWISMSRRVSLVLVLLEGRVGSMRRFTQWRYIELIISIALAAHFLEQLCPS